jgi:menaquinone-dependent protoporphyrinogen oxidase
MERLLIVYATSHGWTGRIVDRMARGLREMGMVPSIYLVDDARDLDLASFDGVLLAGSVQFGRHQRHLEDYARRHAAALTRLPSAFLSVCGALAGSWSGGHAEATKYRDDFERRTGWRPVMSWSVAGRLAYTQYSLPTRLVMQFISWRTGRPTDTSRNWEFTDWLEVERLARAFGWGVRARREEQEETAGGKEREAAGANGNKRERPILLQRGDWAERVRSEGWAAGIGWPDG